MATATYPRYWPQTVARFFSDRAVAAMALILTALTLIDHRQAAESARFVAGAIIDILPFFILAILFAAGAKASGLDRLIARAFSGKPVVSIVAGSLAGALSPFCSCGVIPVIAGMLASGVPLSPVMAFCLASPVMDPEMFILTAAGIDMNFAVAKTATAIGLGLFAGFAVAGIQRWGYLRQPLRLTARSGCGNPSFDARAPVEIAWRFWQEPQRATVFCQEIRKNGQFLGKWMTLAFLLESLMLAYLPPQWVAGLVGTGSPLAIPMAAAFGIPAYMNGYAAIPMIAGMMELGMSPGAALSFATAGAVSSIPAALAVYALVKRPVFLVYLSLGTLGAIAAGYAYQALI